MILDPAAQRPTFNLQRKSWPMIKEPDRNQRKALGKGLSALLPSRTGGTTPAVEPETLPGPGFRSRPSLPDKFEEFQSIPLDRIEPNREQPRSAFDSEKLEELAQSIRANGMIQPIT